MTVSPQNTTVNQSGTVTFQCKGESQTEMPSVVWYKEEPEGEKEVKNSNRVAVSTDGDLQIQVSFLSFIVVYGTRCYENLYIDR